MSLPRVGVTRGQTWNAGKGTSPLGTGSHVRQHLPWFDTSDADLHFLRNGGEGKMSRLHSLSEKWLDSTVQTGWFVVVVCFVLVCLFVLDL